MKRTLALGALLFLLAGAPLLAQPPTANARKLQGRAISPTAPTNLQAMLWTCTVPSVAFTGSGLNDASSGGTCTANTASLYEVVIDSAVASPDTFKWRKDGGSWTTGVSMTGSPQTLTDGVTITFKATDGHTLTDAWAIATTVAWVPGSAPAHTQTFTRQFTFMLGADNGAVLVDGDDQKQIWWNNLGSTATITKVGCICDGGTPSVNLQRDDGSAANILAGDLTCTTTGATTTSFSGSEATITDGYKVDFVMVAAGGTAKRLTLTGTYTVVQ